MKQYLIRNTGWTFNDSTYDRDGMQQIVLSFTDKEEAESYLHMLNREKLCAEFNWIHRLEAGKPGSSFSDYLNELARFMYRECGMNPTVLLPLRIEYNVWMFTEKPSDQLLDKIVDTFDLTHFKMVEIESEQPHYYLAQINGLYNYGYTEYITNGYGDVNAFFHSLPEAMDNYLNFSGYLRNNYDQNSWDTIPKPPQGHYSEMPAMLEGLIQQSPYMRMKDGVLEIDGNAIDTETMLQINALLLVPFITLEPVELTPANYYDQTQIDYILESNARDWKQITERAFRYDSVEALKNSREYLNSFVSQIPFYSHFENPYTDVIRKHVRLLTGRDLPVHFSLYLYTVATDYKEENGQLSLTMFFGLEYNSVNFDLEPGTGSGSDAETAISACLENWFEKHAHVLKHLLAEKIPKQ